MVIVLAVCPMTGACHAPVDRVVRVLGKNTVDLAIQTDIRREKELEQKRLEQMLQGSLSERLKWAESKRDEYNVQRKKNKVKNREMEI